MPRSRLPEAALELAEQAKTAMASAGKLRARLAANPDDHEARMELSTALFGSGEREAAIDELLNFVQARPRVERTSRTQAARQVFRSYGRHRSADFECAAPVVGSDVLLKGGAR